MGKLFTLTNDIKTIAQNAIDDLIDQLGKECKLVYPPKWTACSNCAASAVGNQPSNRWVTGGPVSYPHVAQCPLCNGAGKIAEEVTKTITMLIAWEPAHFFQKGPTVVQVPAGQIQTKGYITDLPKVLQARQMILQPSLENIIRFRFQLDGEPADVGNIIQGRYFVAVWNRAP